MVLAMEDVGGRRLDDARRRTSSTTSCSTRCGARSPTLHGAAHRPPGAAGRERARRRRTARSLIDFGFAEESADRRLQAIDRAELLASLAVLVGADARGRVGARGSSAPTTLAAAMPYLQPLALSAATRKQASKALLQELRDDDRRRDRQRAAVPLERLVRVRPRTL